MADIKIKFMHPTDGRLVDVDMDDTMTPPEVISELIEGGFITSNPQGYNLAKKGGAQIDAGGNFASAGIGEGDVIRVIPATDAGIGPSPAGSAAGFEGRP